MQGRQRLAERGQRHLGTTPTPTPVTRVKSVQTWIGLRLFGETLCQRPCKAVCASLLRELRPGTRWICKLGEPPPNMSESGPGCRGSRDA